ncbi:amidohydrolase family protein [Acinetobacter sp. MB5]|uniref:amidohydrolase family protein n=1 Tax=Acinetobacter sp. MB5 TaxID=2069438 RepID=UPI000DCF902A|nr:amidohydrolase family protein [Acinetobacter sp. MB5]
MIRIDTHAHVFSRHDQCIETARYVPDYDATVEQFLAHLNAHDLTHGVLVQPSFLGTDNSAMLNAIRQFPDRLKGIAVVSHTISLDELLEFKLQGIVGTRINLFGLNVPDLTQSDWQTFLLNLEKVNFQLELHAPPAYLIQVLPILSHYNINIVIDHFGRSVPELGVDDPDYHTFLNLLDSKKHWVKVSGYYRLGSHPENIETAQKAFSLLKVKGMLNKMVWGSDWPHTQHEDLVSYDKTFQVFQKIVANPDEQSMILNQNAIRLFNF